MKIRLAPNLFTTTTKSVESTRLSNKSSNLYRRLLNPLPNENEKSAFMHRVPEASFGKLSSKGCVKL